MLGTAAPAARAAGQSLDTMAGTIAFLSRPLGVNKAAVGFARLTEILGRKKFVDGLKKAGVQIVDSSGKMKQMPDIIEAITRKFPELTKGGVKLVQFFKRLSGTEGTIQARRAFVFLAQQLDQYRKVQGQVEQDNNEFARSLDAMSGTPAVKWKKALNSLRVLMLQIGSDVLPILTDMLEPIQDLVEWFSKLDDETRKQIATWLAYGAAIALIGGSLGLVISVIGQIAVALRGAGIVALLIAISVILRVVTGDFDALREAARRALDFITGSWAGAAVGAVALIAMIVKVSAAFAALRASIAIGMAGSAAAAGGGFLPMLDWLN